MSPSFGGLFFPYSFRPSEKNMAAGGITIMVKDAHAYQGEACPPKTYTFDT